MDADTLRLLLCNVQGTRDAIEALREIAPDVVAQIEAEKLVVA